MTTEERLDQAVELIRAGNKQAAIPILKEILASEPQNETAWLWLYASVDETSQKIFCLQKALEINPANEQARRAFQKLTGATLQPVQQTPAKIPVAAIQPVTSSRSRRWPRVLMIVLVLFLFGLSAFYLVQTGRLSTLAASLPFLQTSSPTPTRRVTGTPSRTPTWTSSPTETITETMTQRPTRTPTPAPITATPTPTIAPFTPGNPTATPLGSEITDPNFKKGAAIFQKAVQDGANNYQAVVELMNAVIATSPGLAPPYQIRGISFWYLGQCQSGLADEQKALSINPNDAMAWADLGLLNECLGNKTEAPLDYQKALSLDPSIAWVYHYLGSYFFKMNLYEKALEENSLSVAIDPTYSAGWSGSSEALSKLNRFDECITAATKAIQLGQTEWLVYSSRAYCELAQNKFSEAIADYKIYIAQVPTDTFAGYNLGLAYGHRGDTYYDAGKYALAIADYKVVASLIKGDAHSSCQLVYSYFALKDYQRTIDAGKAATDANASCGGQKLVDVEGQAAYFLGDYQGAIDFMTQALKLGTDSNAYYYRGISYQATGKNTEAIQDLQIFISLVKTGSQADDAKARLAQLKP